MSSRDLPAILIPMIPIAMLAGCAGMLRTDPIEGDPARTGLVVVSCDITADFQDRDAVTRLTGVDDKAHARSGVVVDADDVELEGRGERGVVIFSNLQPCTYTVMLIRGIRWLTTDAAEKIYDCDGAYAGDCPVGVELEYRLSPEMQDRMTVAVAPGECVFAGSLAFEEPHDPPFDDFRHTFGKARKTDFHACRGNKNFRLETDPGSELEALKKVVASYRENEWTARIGRRIEALEREMKR